MEAVDDPIKVQPTIATRYGMFCYSDIFNNMACMGRVSNSNNT